MDSRLPRTNPPGSRAAAPGGGRSPTDLVNLVKGRLAKDPHWGYFAMNGKWICPFCLSPVNRRTGRSREDSLAVHLEVCRSFAGGRGATQAVEVIANRQQFENLVHLADSDPAWRVYDPTGTWFCPACAERVPSVRIQGGQLTSFVYQAMAEHLGRCNAYLHGVKPKPEDVQRSRDRAARLPALQQALQSNLQFPAWRYLDGNGLWVCPCCLTHVARVHVQTDAEWQRAPEGMAHHLLNECPAYARDPNAIQSEAAVQKAAMEAAAPPPVPIQRTPLPIRTPLPTRGTPSDGLPVARPQGSGGFATTPTYARTVTPEGARQIPVVPVARPATPASVRGVPLDQSMSPRTGTPSLLRRTDTTPTGAPRITVPPVAPPVVTPPPAPPKDDTLFGKLKGDFLAGTALDGAHHDDAAPTEEPPAEEATQHDDKADEGDGDLNWMDNLEGSGKANDPLPAAERTDMIKARAVQAGLMQKAPEIPGFAFAASFEACADISGDFYQFIRLPDGRHGFALGDVSGHGVQAGLIMSMAKKTFEIYALMGLGPADCLSKVNDAIARDLGGKLFISMVYALLDPTEHTITWARAGHNPSLRINIRTDEVEEIKPPGMVVGMKTGPMFRNSIQEQVTQVKSGDLFLLYTDGITETMNLQQEEFGPERLIDVIKRFHSEKPDVLISRIMEVIRHFRGPQPPSDDATLLALTVE
jgi:hypothetical protein